MFHSGFAGEGIAAQLQQDLSLGYILYSIGRQHGLQFPANGFTQTVGDGELSFVHATQPEETEPHLPDTVWGYPDLTDSLPFGFSRFDR